jgi:YARHG domain
MYNTDGRILDVVMTKVAATGLSRDGKKTEVLKSPVAGGGNAGFNQPVPDAVLHPMPAGAMPGERFPETRQRSLNQDDLEKMSYADTQYAINEMFARRGGVFKDNSLDLVFSAKPWYKRREGLNLDEIEKEFTSTEKANLLALAKRRAELSAASTPSSKPKEKISPQRPAPRRNPGIDLDRY